MFKASANSPDPWAVWLESSSRTIAPCPRRAQAARSGGNNNRSVSSSTSVTLRPGRFFSRRRMALFFLPVWVRRQDVTHSLPDVTQFVQLAANAVGGKPAAIPGGQLLPQQRDRPMHGGVAPLRGRFVQQRLQQLPQLGRPTARPTRAGR